MALVSVVEFEDKILTVQECYSNMQQHTVRILCIYFFIQVLYQYHRPPSSH